MPKNVIIVRHAESTANTGMPSVDTASIPLSEKGMQQAERLAHMLPKADIVICSPYIRTRLTAIPYLRKFPEIPTEEWPCIREFTYLSGQKYNNTTPQERIIPKESFWSTNDPYYSDGLDAESFADFVYRAEEALHTIAFYTSQTIVVFTHEQFIQLIEFIHKYPNYSEYRKSDAGMKVIIDGSSTISIHRNSLQV